MVFVLLVRISRAPFHTGLETVGSCPKVWCADAGGVHRDRGSSAIAG